MWRPFVFSLANHAYENYARRVGRAESAPLNARGDQEKAKKAKSVSFFSEEAEKRVQDFENLKKKVKQQRELRKLQEKANKLKVEIRLKVVKENQARMRMKKMQELRRVRAMSSCKPSRVVPGKSVFELTCVENCRKLKDGLMSEIKKINKGYMKKIRLSSLGNKENSYRGVKGWERMKEMGKGLYSL